MEPRPSGFRSQLPARCLTSHELLQSAPRPRGRDEVALLLVEPKGLFQGHGGFATTSGKPEDFGEVRQRRAMRVEEIALRRERHRFTGERLGRAKRSLVCERLYARAAPKKLGMDIVRPCCVLTLPAEPLRLVVAPQCAHRSREVAGVRG